MRRVLLVLCLVVATSAFAQPTITQAEYFVGSDPGEGLATPLSISAPAPSVSLSWIIPTDMLSPGLHRAMVRVRRDDGLWSMPNTQYLIVSPANHAPLLVTQFEWSVDNGAFTPVDIDDASIVSITQLLSTVSLAPGILHTVHLRVTDNTGRTGLPHIGFLVIAPANQQPRLITQFEYAVDNGEYTVVDVADGNNIFLTQVISTIGLTPGSLHSIRIRVTDDLGRVSSFTNVLLPILPVTADVRDVTSYEYWVDSNAPTLVDNPDAPVVNITELIATNTLFIGLHHVNIRTTDDLGRTGKEHRVPFIVMSSFQESDPRTIVAAEVFVGSDPGIGNGIAIPIPSDGAWDESEEAVAHVFTGFNVGYYRIGIRLQDNLGRWSAAEFDSLLVGPLLTVIPDGNNVILNWQFPDNIDKYYIHRATNTAGPFSLIDSTVARTYTDPGIVPLQDKGFYYVTFRDDSISLRMPAGSTGIR